MDPFSQMRKVQQQQPSCQWSQAAKHFYIKKLCFLPFFPFFSAPTVKEFLCVCPSFTSLHLNKKLAPIIIIMPITVAATGNVHFWISRLLEIHVIFLYNSPFESIDLNTSNKDSFFGQLSSHHWRDFLKQIKAS